ncbi:MAG TPA: DUF3365 domain-containing protein, partial [Opitutaceae bacterium]|nr:DUF3365 domain-containing protein [Opitutaceae bacterium]
MKLGTKITFAAISSIVVAVGVSLVIQKRTIEKQGIELLRGTMHAALVEAESMRESVSELGVSGAFDQEKLLADYKASGDLRSSTLYRTIPVVAAWEAAGKAAEALGMTFRISKQQARNTKNLPTPEELPMLEYLGTPGAEEYFLADRSTNTIVLARPVRLTQDCMSCHGDPATSPTKDAKDLVGNTMENWKPGEVHGAFVLKTDFSRVDQAVSQGMTSSLLWVGSVTLVIALGFTWMNQRMIVRPLRATADTLVQGSEQIASASNQVSASSQTLAKGASEQASSLEETSAAIEEMSSMTRRNSEHANQARELAMSARATADASSISVTRLNSAMDELKASSAEVAKIVKTIDEIAFQTNLLA